MRDRDEAPRRPAEAGPAAHVVVIGAGRRASPSRPGLGSLCRSRGPAFWSSTSPRQPPWGDGQSGPASIRRRGRVRRPGSPIKTNARRMVGAVAAPLDGVRLSLGWRPTPLASMACVQPPRRCRTCGNSGGQQWQPQNARAAGVHPHGSMVDTRSCSRAAWAS